MKKHLVLILVVLSAFNSFAQQDSLQNQILGYHDPDFEIISKGRALLAYKFQKGDLQKVKEIKDFLEAKAKGQDYMAFYPMEDALLSYWTKEYDTLLAGYRVDDSLATLTGKRTYGYDFLYADVNLVHQKVPPPRDLLEQKLFERSRDSIALLYSFIGGSALEREDKDYLKMRLQYLLNQLSFKPANREKLNEAADRFLEKYPNSHHAPFVKNYVRINFQPSKWAFTAEFFSGYTILTKELTSTFTNPVPIGVAFDIYYKRSVLLLRDFIGFNKTRTGVPYNNGVWEKGSQVRTYLPEAALGYVVLDNKTAKIIPFAGYAGTAFLPTDYDQQHNPALDKAGLQFTNTFTAGLSLDIKLGVSKFSTRLMGLADDENYGFLRIRYGYAMPNYQKRYNGYSGGIHYITIGIGGFSRRMKRKY